MLKVNSLTMDVIQKRLGLKRSTFYHYVRCGVLQKSKPNSCYYTPDSVLDLQVYLKCKNKIKQSDKRYKKNNTLMMERLDKQLGLGTPELETLGFDVDELNVQSITDTVNNRVKNVS